MFIDTTHGIGWLTLGIMAAMVFTPSSNATTGTAGRAAAWLSSDTTRVEIAKRDADKSAAENFAHQQSESLATRSADPQR